MSDRVQRYDNAVRADLIVDALVQAGIGIVFVCPGSRSTPLVMAFERKRMRTHVVLDERTAAYAAVGAARMGVPAAVCTTSGTAVANLLPAMCEADLDELAIVALTADRPRSAIDTGANQTLNQAPLLAGAARIVLDLDASSETTLTITEVCEQLRHALGHLHGHRRGPVHINARFAKPLEPPDGYEPTTPATLPAPAPAAVLELPWSSWWSGKQAGMVVCGALPLSARDHAAELIHKLGWPALVDVSSGLTSLAVPYLSASVLRSATMRTHLKPDVVLWLGGTAVEDAVSSWSRASGAVLVQLRTGHRVRDPDRMFSTSVVCDPQQWMPNAAAPPSAMTAVVRMLAARDDALRHHENMTTLTEPAIAHAVASSVGSGDILLLGNSMPVRDVGRFGHAAPGSIVIGNRGLSGIDGTFGTALGASLVSGRAVTVLVGDLTALHDMTGLFALTTSSSQSDGAEEKKDGNPGIRVVAENNDGGGIFSFLPIGMHDRATNVFEKNFGTPHGKQLAPIAEALGARSGRIDDLVTLQQRLATPVAGGVEFIEVCTSRTANVTDHRRLDEARDRGLESPQLVFVHGALGCAADWQAVRDRLSLSSMAVEVPGHGSRYADGADDVVSKLMEHIDAMATEPVVLVGYSLGARLALQMALRQPRWLRGLVLESVHPGLPTEEERQRRQQQDDDFATMVVKDPYGVVASFYQRPVFASLQTRSDFADIVHRRAARAARKPEVLSAMWRATSLGKQPSLSSLLPSISVPALVITGALDPAYGEHGTRIASVMPQAQHRVVADAGHNVHLEQVDAYVDAVSSWLSSWLSTSGAPR